MNLGSAELHHTECGTGSLKTLGIFSRYCPKVLTFNLKLYFKGKKMFNYRDTSTHPTESDGGFILS